MKEAVLISWVGMSLVFIGLIALWLMMVILVKFTNINKPVETSTEPIITSIDIKEQDNKRKAAAVAVVIARQLKNSSISSLTKSKKEEISPWQAAHRAHQITQSQSNLIRKD